MPINFVREIGNRNVKKFILKYLVCHFVPKIAQILFVVKESNGKVFQNKGNIRGSL